jgi:cytochrome c peroxidase
MRAAQDDTPKHPLPVTPRAGAAALLAAVAFAVTSGAPAAPAAVAAPAAPVALAADACTNAKAARDAATSQVDPRAKVTLNDQVQAVLAANGFDGTVQSCVETRLGHAFNLQLQNLGRMLFFDPILSLHNDNSCAGCHDPGSGFADAQPIAIGVESPAMVAGPSRIGPRNQRRTPTIINSVFYPAMMWDGRFFAPSGDPFDNSKGFTFPQPEGTTKFLPGDPYVNILAAAQAHMPSTELKEQAGFTGTRGTLGQQWDQFDDGLGQAVPPPDGSGYRNDPIRAAVEVRLNASRHYRVRFGELFSEVAAGAPITFAMVGRAIGEWEATMARANAPLDRFARGALSAMTDDEKYGALLFFGKANCVACHATAGTANQMFSDFQAHNIGVPQIAPAFGVGTGDFIFDGPGLNEDYGLENITHNAADRYKFRTAPLRNLAMQPRYFHNGSFNDLALAIRHHLDVVTSARSYVPGQNGVPPDLRKNRPPVDNVLSTNLDPLVATPVVLTDVEFNQLYAFVSHALLDAKDSRGTNCGRVPLRLPSRMKGLSFEGCTKMANDGGRLVLP